LPVDHIKLSTINDAQLAWYQLQGILDDQDNFELLRDVAEHNAMFSNPEGVQQVREARENSYEVSEEDFDTILTEAFGRPLPKVDEKEKKDLIDLMNEARGTANIKPYLDVELDEVTFTPFE
jgi:hypothetical protein